MGEKGRRLFIKPENGRKSLFFLLFCVPFRVNWFNCMRFTPVAQWLLAKVNCRWKTQIEMRSRHKHRYSRTLGLIATFYILDRSLAAAGLSPELFFGMNLNSNMAKNMQRQRKTWPNTVFNVHCAWKSYGRFLYSW